MNRGEALADGWNRARSRPGLGDPAAAPGGHPPPCRKPAACQSARAVDKPAAPDYPCAMASHAPIGILDSGVGGWSVLDEIRALLPDESLIYIGDSAWCPYGARPADQIQQRVFQLTDRLIGWGVKLVVLACNSATIAAVEALRATYPIPFAGMEPAVKPAAAASRSGVVGVLATEASLAGEKFHRLIHDHAGGVRVITVPCPGLVELVERGELSGDRAAGVVNGYVAPLVDAGADVLVLGCTHYPFLRKLIEAAAGPAVTVIDTGAAVARRVRQLLERDDLLASGSDDARLRVLTTGPEEQLRQLWPRLWAQSADDAELGRLEE